MKIVNPASLPAARGYNNAVIVGNHIFLAGQIGWDKKGRLASDLVSQFDRAIANVVEIIRGSGARPENITRLTIYIKDKEEYLKRRKEIGEAYRRRIGKHFPAMSLVVVNDLLEEGAMVEIEATAVLE